jgi:hypothetical protein
LALQIDAGSSNTPPQADGAHSVDRPGTSTNGLSEQPQKSADLPANPRVGIVTLSDRSHLNVPPSASIGLLVCSCMHPMGRDEAQHRSAASRSRSTAPRPQASNASATRASTRRRQPTRRATQ